MASAASETMGRRADHVLHEVLHRAAAVSARKETFQLTRVRGTAPLPGVIHVRRLVRDDFIDREANGRGFEGQRPARRQPEEARRPAGFLDERGDVLNLARRRIRLGIAALPAAAAVVRINGEVSRQQRRELRRGAECAAAQRAVDQDQRGAAAGSRVSNGGPVCDLTWLMTPSESEGTRATARRAGSVHPKGAPRRTWETGRG